MIKEDISWSFKSTINQEASDIADELISGYYIINIYIFNLNKAYKTFGFNLNLFIVIMISDMCSWELTQWNSLELNRYVGKKLLFFWGWIMPSNNGALKSLCITQTKR